MPTTKETAKEYKFQAEMQPLLHLLTHSLYTNEEIFLRELISNAADALNKLRFLSITQPDVLGQDEQLKISISLDEKEHRLTIKDNGIGMDEKELIQNLGTVASSGTTKFLKLMEQDAKTGQQPAEKLIGQFGVGFYSVFIVADEVSVTTRKAGEEQSYCWKSGGSGKFTIEPADKKEKGTSISFQLKENKQHLSQNWQIESIIKKYSNFVSFPIEFNSAQLTAGQAIWTRPAKEVKPEEYEEFFKFLNPQAEKPLTWLPLQAEAPTQFRAVLFVPSQLDPQFMNPNTANSSLQLYVKRVFIQDDCKELLPSWLRFVQGVVDSEDLPLNVSRQVTQQSPILSTIRKYLVRKLLTLFKDWADNEQEIFKTFWQQFGKLVKEGIYSDHEQREKLVELLHCYSSHHKKELTNLKAYVARMQEGQTSIYYALNSSQQAIESSPNFEYFQKQGWEVLYFDAEVDSFILPIIPEFEKTALVNIDQAELQPLPEAEPSNKNSKDELDAAAQSKLLQYFKDLLKDEVVDVVQSKRLVDSPCTLVDPKDAPNRQMEQLMKMMNQQTEVSKKILEVNLQSPLIISLGKIQKQRPQDPVLKDCIIQLYHNTLLRDGNLQDPAEMIARSHRLLQQLTGKHVEELQNNDAPQS